MFLRGELPGERAVRGRARPRHRHALRHRRAVLPEPPAHRLRQPLRLSPVEYVLQSESCCRQPPVLGRTRRDRRFPLRRCRTPMAGVRVGRASGMSDPVPPTRTACRTVRGHVGRAGHRRWREHGRGAARRAARRRRRPGDARRRRGRSPRGATQLGATVPRRRRRRRRSRPCAAAVIAVKPPRRARRRRRRPSPPARRASCRSPPACRSPTIQAAAGDGVAVVRAMPNTPALVGQGASAIAGGASADRRRPGVGRARPRRRRHRRARRRAAPRRRHRAQRLGPGVPVPRRRGADRRRRGRRPGRAARRGADDAALRRLGRAARRPRRPRRAAGDGDVAGGDDGRRAGTCSRPAPCAPRSPTRCRRRRRAAPNWALTA